MTQPTIVPDEATPLLGELIGKLQEIERIWPQSRQRVGCASSIQEVKVMWEYVDMAVNDTLQDYVDKKNDEGY